MSKIPKSIGDSLAEMKEQEQRQKFRGFTVAELRTLFDAVADPADWKGPLRNTVRAGPGAARLLRQIAAAVVYFTATEVEVREVLVGGRLDHYEVTSVGYRAGPAGP
jgi:hypothetical protein